MKSNDRCCIAVLSTAVVLSTFAGNRCRAEVPKLGNAPQPLTPAESAARMRLPDGFEIEILASEPLLADPSCVAFDERGRVFVSELHGYNLEGQLDGRFLTVPIHDGFLREFDRVVTCVGHSTEAQHENCKRYHFHGDY